ncbi:MAG: hypothetical protein ABI034_04560 [Nakamurella sp.]
MPPALRAALAPGEEVTAAVPADSGLSLAASRFGLWIVSGDDAERIDWHVVSKARLAEGALHLTIADEVATWADSTVLLRDREPRTFRPEHATRLTDVVHRRVRASVAASRHMDWPGAGCWVVLRRIAGLDGLTVQVRLDHGTDPALAGFAEAVSAVVDQMWPEQVPRHADRTDLDE